MKTLTTELIQNLATIPLKPWAEDMLRVVQYAMPKADGQKMAGDVGVFIENIQMVKISRFLKEEGFKKDNAASGTIVFLSKEERKNGIIMEEDDGGFYMNFFGKHSGR